jgi:hypothetical protein
MKLKISIVVDGKWHTFDLPWEFDLQGNLHPLI